MVLFSDGVMIKTRKTFRFLKSNLSQYFNGQFRLPIRTISTDFKGTYSDLPNNCPTNLIIFLGKKTPTQLLGPTRSLISEIFPSKPTNMNETNPSYTALLEYLCFM